MSGPPPGPPAFAAAGTAGTPASAGPAAAPTPLGRGIQTGLLQRNQPAFWLFVVLVFFSALYVLSEQLIMLDVAPTGWMFGLFLLVLYVIPVAVFIYVLDLFEREPISLLVAAFVWGGVVAIALSASTNGAALELVAKIAGPDLATRWGPALVAPPVEEGFKFLGVVMIYLIARHEIDDVLDGFVYGAFVGLGFAAVENLFYMIQHGPQMGGEIGGVFFMFFMRAILFGAYGHVLYTAIAGAGLAYYVTRHDQPRDKRLLVAVGLFGLAMLAHFIWNSPLFHEIAGDGAIFSLALYGLVKGGPFFIFLVVLLVLGQRREHEWFKSVMASHLDGDVITPEEMEQLRGLRSRWQARRAASQHKGPQGGALMKRLQSEQIRLALLLSHSSEDDPAVIAQRDLIRQIRAELQALPELPSGARAPYSPALAAPIVAPSFAPTHYVPANGLQAWDAPDPARPPVATLAPGVQLQLVEQNGAWAKVVGSNGWSGWVDGRLLVAYR